MACKTVGSGERPVLGGLSRGGRLLALHGWNGQVKNRSCARNCARDAPRQAETGEMQRTESASRRELAEVSAVTKDS